MATTTKSIKLTIFLMRVIGLWHSPNRLRKMLSKAVLTLVSLLMLYSVFLQGQELYYSKKSITMITFAAPVATVVLTETSKLAVLLFKYKKMRKLNKFMDEEFLNNTNTKEEAVIFNHCDRLCFRMIRFYIILLLGTCSLYWIIPIISMFTEPIPKREFPFPMRIESPLYESPYYEMYFALEIIAIAATGLCVTTFASYLFTINLFTATQFKILNMHLQSLCDFEEESKDCKNIVHQREALRKLKDYIVRHQMLIDLTKEIEDLFCYVMLEQVFGSTTQICFCGMQILLAGKTLQRTILSIQFLLSSILQLYFYCYSSHKIFEASESVSQAMYSMKWYKMTDPQVHKEFSQLFHIITIRAQRPCILTYGKFYPLTLATFMSVLSTSMSYFTVLRQILCNNN